MVISRPEILVNLGGVHKLRLQDLSFFDTYPPSFTFSMISLQKVDFFDHLPHSSCKRSLWTAPNMKENDLQNTKEAYYMQKRFSLLEDLSI